MGLINWLTSSSDSPSNHFPTEGQLERAAHRSDLAGDKKHEEWHANRRATGDPGGINYDPKRRG